ncbi:MAG: hypothetical protein OQJ96_01410 [Flavobacteriales bacterium]|nr:hypothetical protein [Flavobacteriales bacterium]MCW8912580.1 hypothetical protein [Flavobacteriales bacterium]MCW8938185.1 hypothetical protein [Flavobacteriales bacterium]MCW8941017.1 hypothetical protein [Flavobacteriales bacterium]MCW8967023.1 hypothetical protein [Flavobacteriales bacterium]
MKNLLLILLCGIGINMYAQSEIIAKEYTVLREYVWENDSDFHIVPSKDIGNQRIITILPDANGMVIEINNPNDTIVIYAEIINIYEVEINGFPATAYSILSTEGFPFYLEMATDAVAFYYDFNPSEGGYGGYLGSELLLEIIK